MKDVFEMGVRGRIRVEGPGKEIRRPNIMAKNLSGVMDTFSGARWVRNMDKKGRV